MSNIQATMCFMSYSSKIPRTCNAHKLCILFVYTKKEKLENKGGNKQSHSNDHIMRYLNERHTCTLKCRVHHM